MNFVLADDAAWGLRSRMDEGDRYAEAERPQAACRSRMKKTERRTPPRGFKLLKKTSRSLELCRPCMHERRLRQQAAGRTLAQWVGVLDRALQPKTHRQIANTFRAAHRTGVSELTAGTSASRSSRPRTTPGRRIRSEQEPHVPCFGGCSLQCFHKRSASAGVGCPVKIAVRSATPQKRMRVTWDDDTVAVLNFTSKELRRATVAVGHQKLPTDQPRMR